MLLVIVRHPDKLRACKEEVVLDASSTQYQDWPQRSWGLAALGASLGLVIHLLLQAAERAGPVGPSILLALMFFLATAGIVFSFTLIRAAPRESAAFALICGAVVGCAIWFTGQVGAQYDWAVPRIPAAAVAVVIATPLFQAWRAAGRPRQSLISCLTYPVAHDHAWMAAMLWGACWLFAGITILLSFLLGGLFDLIGIHFVSKLVNEQWFGFALAGGAFGAAAGVFRDREAILLTLQTVIRRILSVLAPALGAGLILFLIATIFTGLEPLWEATKATTPLLIGSGAIAAILANAAIGDSPDDEAKLRVLRWGSLALAISIFPLTIIAAISTGLRVNQHGLSPDRIWAMIIVAVACICGACYWVALVRGRGDWFAWARRANLRLAFGLCGLALVLSTPLFNFASISTHNQVARLKAGKVTPAAFSWSALRYEYGAEGIAALKELAASGSSEAIKAQAKSALADKSGSPWAMQDTERTAQKANELERLLIVQPKPIVLPAGLKTAIAATQGCEAGARCIVYHEAGTKEAFVIWKPCDTCAPNAKYLWTERGDWSDSPELSNKPADNLNNFTMETFSKGKVEIRDVVRRRVYIDGKRIDGAYNEQEIGEKK